MKYARLTLHMDPYAQDAEDDEEFEEYGYLAMGTGVEESHELYKVTILYRQSALEEQTHCWAIELAARDAEEADRLACRDFRAIGSLTLSQREIVSVKVELS